jgi:DNA (cytosine-5)-methyltransferase 1
MKDKITMIEIFSGIGSQTKALGQLPIPHEVVHTMDVEKDAILAYAAMRYDLEEEMKTFNFPSKQQMVLELQAKNVGYDFVKQKHTITMKMNENKIKLYYIADKLSKNLGDVSLQKSLPYVDVIFHSSPCQAFSLAGKGEGGDEGSGTTSSLMWESLRLIETSNCEYVVWENVAAVLSGKHRHNFLK